MRESQVEAGLLSIFFYMLGLCSGVVIVEQSIGVSEISNVTLATVAILGLFSWKKAIDYQERKNDKKLLVRAIKKLELTSDKALQRAGFPLSRLHKRFETRTPLTEFEKSLIREDLSKISSATALMHKVQLEIETEASSNRIVLESETLSENIANLIIKNRSLANFADSIYFSERHVDLNGPLENFSRYGESVESFSKTYQDYYTSSMLIEHELGVSEATMRKQEVFRSHYDSESDETPQTEKVVVED